MSRLGHRENPLLVISSWLGGDGDQGGSTGGAGNRLLITPVFNPGEARRWMER